MLFALPVYCLFRNKHQYSEHRPCVDKKERASVNRTQKKRQQQPQQQQKYTNTKVNDGA